MDTRVPTIYVLSKNKKNITIFHLKISIFTAVKNCSILHGRVFVICTCSLYTIFQFETKGRGLFLIVLFLGVIAYYVLNCTEKILDHHVIMIFLTTMMPFCFIATPCSHVTQMSVHKGDDCL